MKTKFAGTLTSFKEELYPKVKTICRSQFFNEPQSTQSTQSKRRKTCLTKLYWFLITNYELR